MRTLFCTIVLAILIQCGFSTLTLAQQIFVQEECDFSKNDEGVACVKMSSGAKTAVKLRSFPFTVPARGNAVLHFQGSMVCSSVNKDPAVVDFVTQIVMDETNTPQLGGLGSVRHAAVLAPGPLGTSLSFNLGTTMAVAVPAGLSVATFSINPLRMDKSTSCVFYTLSFSVIYVESRS